MEETPYNNEPLTEEQKHSLLRRAAKELNILDYYQSTITRHVSSENSYAFLWQELIAMTLRNRLLWHLYTKSRRMKAKTRQWADAWSKSQAELRSAQAEIAVLNEAVKNLVQQAADRKKEAE